MSETVTGKLEEIVAVSSGKGKRGPWTLWAVVVDGDRYGTKFDKVKAAVGDTVEFDWAENEKGYNDVVEGTFRVVKKATGAESAAASKANAENGTAKQSSIENQKALEYATAIALAIADEGSGIDDVLTNLQRAFKVCSGLLHPTAAPAAAKAKAAAKKAETPPEEDEDEIPY